MAKIQHQNLCFSSSSVHHHLSINRKGCWGTTDNFTISFHHFSLFSTAIWDLVNSRPVHSLMLSSHLFLCLPCLLPPFTVLCKMVFARPDKHETWPYHCSLRLFTMIRRSSCGPVACWILAWTSSLVTWSLYSSFELCCEGHWGTTDDFATSFLHFFLFSTTIWDLLNSRPVHFLMFKG